MPQQYPREFRERIIATARAGRPVSELSADYGVSDATIFRWIKQDRIDHGEVPGTTSAENIELAAAKKRIRELEHELDLVREAAKIFDEQEKVHPKGSSR
ncbi:MAG: transposase [Thermoleophilaceae bacterium]|nr:transposase [Thermoleophilaceae bacterium]